MAYFFGYGSLVNTATHRYREVLPANLSGFYRVWVNNDCYAHAFLSVIADVAGDAGADVAQAPPSGIQGLLARVDNDDWQALDKRERGYCRRLLKPEQWSVLQPPREVLGEVQIYQHAYGSFAEGDNQGDKQGDKPILWSYLETVLLGYYQLFGGAGVAGFIDTTKHWTAILDDRQHALYPRYTAATGEAGGIITPLIQQLALAAAD